jgi:hypothetical protein
VTLKDEITVLERQRHGVDIRFAPVDRAMLAALLHH